MKLTLKALKGVTSKMKFIPTKLALAVTLFVSGAPVFADTCDYRPSHLLGDNGSKAVVGVSTAVGGGGAVAASVGLYTLVNAGSGLTMLGSTAAGISGAGTVGIIAGTGGVIGSAGAVILNPFVWIPAAIVGIGGGGFEAACAFLVDERITDYEDVLTIMKSFALTSDPNYFMLVEGAMKPFIKLTDANGSMTSYEVEDLYIVDGMLKSRDYGPNTKIGRVVFLSD